MKLYQIWLRQIDAILDNVMKMKNYQNRLLNFNNSIKTSFKNISNLKRSYKFLRNKLKSNN